MSALRTLAKQTLTYGVSSIAARILNALVPLMYVNRFQPAEFGIVSDLYAWIAYFLIILTFGMETSFFRFSHKIDPKASTEEKLAQANLAYDNAFLSVTFFTLLFALLAAINAGSLANLLGYPGHATLILLIIGVVVVDTLLAMPKALLRHREQPRRFVQLLLINIGLAFLLNILFIFILRLGIEYIFVAELLSSLVCLLLALKGTLPSRWLPDRATLVPMLTYGGYIMIAGLLGQLNEMVDKNLIPRLWPAGQLYHGKPRSGLEMNGIYNASYRLGMLIPLATQAFRYAAEPFFFKQAGSKQSPILFARVFHYFVLAGLVVFVFTASFSHELVSFTAFGLLHKPIFGRNYWLGTEILPIVLISNICAGAYINFSIWFKLTGQIRFGLLFSVVGLGITLGVNYAFLPHFGYMASAWAHLLCNGCMAWLCYVLGQRYYPVPYKLMRLVVYLLLALGAFLFGEFLGTLLPNPTLFLFKTGICLGWVGLVVLAEWRLPLFKAAKPG